MNARIILRSIGIGLITAALIFAGVEVIKKTVKTGGKVVASATKEPVTVSQNAGETDTPGATDDPKQTPLPGSTVTPSTGDPVIVNPDEQASDKSYTLKIEEGTSAATVASKLEQAGLIKNSSEFTEVLTNRGYSEKIKTGTYDIKYGSTYDQIINALTNTTK